MNNSYLFIFLFLFSCKNINCQNEDYFFNPNCDEYDNKLTDDNCFNRIIMFNNKNYQVNHFAKNKNGDFVAEFTEYSEYDELSSSRLFYGLTNDGWHFFSNESSNTRELNIDIDEETYYENSFFNLYGIYNSKNLFVTIRNPANSGNQYLFSINSYNSMVELHDLNNNDNKYQIWSFNEFFKVDEEEYFWPYNYKLFELKKESAYIIAFIPTFEVIEDMLNVSFIKKFKFKSFDKNAYEELNSVKFENYLNQKILNIVLMDDTYTLVVLTKESEVLPNAFGRRRISTIIPPGKQILQKRENDNILYYKFNLKFYSNSLRSAFKEMVIYGSYLTASNEGESLFIKSLYLNNKIVAFIYYRNPFPYIEIELIELKSQIGTNEISPFNFGEFEIITKFNFYLYYP